MRLLLSTLSRLDALTRFERPLPREERLGIAPEPDEYASRVERLHAGELTGHPDRAHRSLDGDRRRLRDLVRSPRRRVVQRVGGDDLRDEPDSTGALCSHPLAR